MNIPQRMDTTLTLIVHNSLWRSLPMLFPWQVIFHIQLGVGGFVIEFEPLSHMVWWLILFWWHVISNWTWVSQTWLWFPIMTDTKLVTKSHATSNASVIKPELLSDTIQKLRPCSYVIKFTWPRPEKGKDRDFMLHVSLSLPHRRYLRSVLVGNTS